MAARQQHVHVVGQRSATASQPASCRTASFMARILRHMLADGVPKGQARYDDIDRWPETKHTTRTRGRVTVSVDVTARCHTAAAARRSCLSRHINNICVHDSRILALVAAGADSYGSWCCAFHGKRRLAAMRNRRSDGGTACSSARPVYARHGVPSRRGWILLHEGEPHHTLARPWSVVPTPTTLCRGVARSHTSSLRPKGPFLPSPKLVSRHAQTTRGRTW